MPGGMGRLRFGVRNACNPEGNAFQLRESA